ncbi:MAG TPA: hypothetical protein DDY79_13485 [Brevundimonas sp.]|nr:hypothetical protein [Brevundimonas sp.]
MGHIVDGENIPVSGEYTVAQRHGLTGLKRPTRRLVSGAIHFENGGELIGPGHASAPFIRPARLSIRAEVVACAIGGVGGPEETPR